MRSIVLQSPAKLNLFLKVLNKRPDGYHNIVTLFERIDLFDDLQFTLNKAGKIRVFCDHRQVPTGPKNLVYQAAQLLKNHFAFGGGVDIKIAKRIPVAAGLAGGSSNAATTLLGLSHIWKLVLTEQELLFFAKKLGSDVPFFIKNCSWALGTQRGDQIEKLPVTTRLWHILVVPKINMYTRKVFGSLKLHSSSISRDEAVSAGNLATSLTYHGSAGSGQTNILTKLSDDVNILIHHLVKNEVDHIGPRLHNDLETAIIQIKPSLRKLKNRLSSLITWGVAFSGSGPAIFGLVETRKQAEALQRELSKRFRQVFVVRTF